VDRWLETYARVKLNLDQDEEDEEDDPERGRFGLHYPLWYALSTWVENREHGSLPETGALNDQDAAWLEDKRAMDARYSLWLKRLQPELDAKYESGGRSRRKYSGGEDAWRDLFDGDEAVGDWQAMLKD